MSATVYRNLMAAVLLLVLFSCQRSATESALAIKEWGPGDIKAGVPFSVQPNGSSAIWTKTEHATPTTVLVLNNVELASVVGEGGKVVTALVPAALYKTPGKYPLVLLDKATGRKSNEMSFVVK